MNAHAPGPWFVNGTDVDAIDHDTYYTVASVWNDTFTAPANWANARLIAAAPDLLDGLQTILEILQNGKTVDAINDAHWIEILIERATGESP